jgi:hypothetical protein
MPVSEGACLFGIRIDRFKLIDYYSVPWDDVPAQTPAPVMIATRDLATGKEEAFAWHLLAEAQGIPPQEIPSRWFDLERSALQSLFTHFQDNPKTWWLHWGLHGIEFGFPALAQRAKALDLGDLRFPERRSIDLAELLKNRLGEDYVPHNRLKNLILLNQINRLGLLEVTELTASYRAGEFSRMLRSLRRKLYCISQIVELGAAGRLQAAGGRLVVLSCSGEGDKARWITCARSFLDDGRTAGSSVTLTDASGGNLLEKVSPFIPSKLQRRILESLNGKAMTQDTLARKLDYERSSLHRHGLKELKQRGKIRNSRRVRGYYRPDAPPPEYREYLQETPSDLI